MVLSGSFTRPVWPAKGDTLMADFGRFALCRCSLYDRGREQPVQGRLEGL